MFCGIQDFTVEVPRPQFYLEPRYRSFVKRAGGDELPVLGIMPETEIRVFKRLQTKNALPCGKTPLLIRSEYEEIENFLEEVVSDKWSGPSAGRCPTIGKKLDYKISGQPGTGM